MGYIGVRWGKFRENRLYFDSKRVCIKMNTEHKFSFEGVVIDGEVP